eukprot:7805511-Pyramimonas_sp.AAC.1
MWEAKLEPDVICSTVRGPARARRSSVLSAFPGPRGRPAGRRCPKNGLGIAPRGSRGRQDSLRAPLGAPIQP